MGKTKPRGRYQSISLSVPFLKEIKKYIMDDPKYRSVADFTREALREKMHREGNEYFGPPGVDTIDRLTRGKTLKEKKFRDWQISVEETLKDIIAEVKKKK